MSSKGTIDLRKRKVGGSRTKPIFFPRATTKRGSALRTHRRRMRALWIFVCVLLAGGFLYGVSWTSHLPRLTVTSIAVSGAEQVQPSLVEKYVSTQLFEGAYSLLSKSNIFFFPREKIQEKIAEYFPRIKSAHISRESLLAQAVTVTIEERQPRGRWCLPAQTGNDTCYLLDENGFIFAQDDTSSGATLYTFRGALEKTGSPIGQIFLPEHFTDLLTLLEKLKQGGYFPQTVSESDEDFSIELARGYSVRASFNDDVQKIVRNLELVLSSDALRGKEGELEYVDLRFGNRVYYKFKNGEEGSQ